MVHDISTGVGPLDISNVSEEITDEDVADPSPLPKVCGDYLLVRPVKTNTEKVGSVFLPDSTRGDVKYLHNVGRILSMGPSDRDWETRR